MTSKLPVNTGHLAIVHEQTNPHAPTLVFLHDSLGCIKTWRDFPQQLARATGCNYLIYDRIGYGESSPAPQALHRTKDYLMQEATALTDLLQRLAISKPVLFGHSDGGSIALLAAASGDHPVIGLILEAAHIFVEDLTLAGIRKVKESYPNGKLREKLRKYHGAKTDTVFYSWANTWLDPAFRDWSIESMLPQITCPCLIIQGEKDEFGTLRQVEGIEKKVNGKIQKEILKNIGHSPHKEGSSLTLGICTDFVNRIINLSCDAT